VGGDEGGSKSKAKPPSGLLAGSASMINPKQKSMQVPTPPFLEAKGGRDVLFKFLIPPSFFVKGGG